MARLTVTATVPASALPTDAMRLFVGDEGAASLAASAPAGGRAVRDATLGDKADGSGASSFTLVYRYPSTAPCAQLPVGVALVDAAGNVSAPAETLVQLADPPAGVNDLAVAPADDGPPDNAIAGAADLTWSASPDVVAGSGSTASSALDLLDVLGPPFDLDAELSVGVPGYGLYERPTRQRPAGGDTLVAFLDPGATAYRYQGAAPNTERYVYVRAFGCSGVADIESVRSKLQRVAFDANGDLVLPAPNTPHALSAEAAAGGRVRVRFAYAPAGQAAAVSVYRVYAAESPASIDPDATPAVSPDYVAPQGVEIGPFTDGATVRVAVLAEAQDGSRSALTDEVEVVVDATAPAAPTGLVVGVA